MTDTAAARSPRSRARIAGIFYLLTIVISASAFALAEPLRSAALLGSTACYLAVTALFYRIFEAVSRKVSATAALFSLAGCTLSILGVFHLGSWGPNPLVFFGCYCLTIGYLIVRSQFLPRTLGVLMALGGLGWLTFISPQLSSHLSPYNMAPGVFGETALTLWLLTMGVSAQRWSRQAGTG